MEVPHFPKPHLDLKCYNKPKKKGKQKNKNIYLPIILFEFDFNLFLPIFPIATIGCR
jgi:hypothetical protein